jgi:MFS family permease
LVFQLSHSAFYVGLDAAVSTMPTLFLSLFGGVIVDRFPKRKILLFTQSASMILAFILGFLAVFKIIQVWQIIVLAFLLGVVNAVDSPARQAYVVELVDDRKHLTSAIALNSGMFNAARVIGPTIAGLLIAGLGAGTAFILNGISYIAVIISLTYITTNDKVVPTNIHPLTAIKEGLKYTFFQPTIRLLLMTAAIVSIFGWSYATLMPVFAHDVFKLNASGLGYLYAVAGTGALVGAFFISAYSHKFNSWLIIIAGNLLFSISLLIFTFISNVYLAGFFLFLIGMGLVSQFSMINTTIQHLVDDKMRGRVMSIYTIAFIGLAPIGNFEIGLAAEKLGTEMAIRISALIVVVFGLIMFSGYFLSRRRKIQQ